MSVSFGVKPKDGRYLDLQDKCVVCLEKLETADISLLKCPSGPHALHAACLGKHIESKHFKCPECNANITPAVHAVAAALVARVKQANGIAQNDWETPLENYIHNIPDDGVPPPVEVIDLTGEDD